MDPDATLREMVDCFEGEFQDRARFCDLALSYTEWRANKHGYEPEIRVCGDTIHRLLVAASQIR